MRTSSVLFLILFAACSDSVTIEGNLLEAAAAEEVRFTDASSLLEEGEFRIQGITGDTVELVFSDGEGGEGRLTISGLPSRGRIRLRDVWIADGVAFPTRVEARGDSVLIINGLRMGGADRIDGDQEIAGTILSISPEDGTLLLRPDDEALPDVGVFVGTGTVLQTTGGDPVDFGQLGFGDALVVRGVGASGYILSNAILAVGGSASAPADQAPPPVIGVDSVIDPSDENRDEDNAADRDDDDRDRDEGPGRGNRGRGRPGFTPGRRS